MSSVRHDSYLRGAIKRRHDAVSGLHFVLMFAAAALLVLARVEHPVVVSLQVAVRQVAQPALGELAGFAEPIRRMALNATRAFVVDTEFSRLERELATLHRLLERTSDLAKRNEELARLVHLVRGAPVSAVTAEVIAGPAGLFGKSVQLGAGRGDGLRYGQPVFGPDGLFGRVSAVSEATARVLVLNDINSRIPVEVGGKQLPALLVGDDSDRPRLVYLSAAEAVTDGDDVVTSGASGEFPRGIKVGRVVKGTEDVRVRTHASLVAGSYLTVLRYALPTAGAPQEPAGNGAARIVSGTPVAGQDRAKQ